MTLVPYIANKEPFGMQTITFNRDWRPDFNPAEAKLSVCLYTLQHIIPMTPGMIGRFMLNLPPQPLHLASGFISIQCDWQTEACAQTRTHTRWQTDTDKIIDESSRLLSLQTLDDNDLFWPRWYTYNIQLDLGTFSDILLWHNFKIPHLTLSNSSGKFS